MRYVARLEAAAGDARPAAEPPRDLLARRRRRSHLRAAAPSGRAGRAHRRSRPDRAHDGIRRVAGARPSAPRRGLSPAAARASSGDELDQPAAHDVSVGIMGLGVMGRAPREALLRARLSACAAGRARRRRIAGVETSPARTGSTPFLPGTDILVSLLPLTPETTGLIDLALLAQAAPRRPARRPGPHQCRTRRHARSRRTSSRRFATARSPAPASTCSQTEPLPPDSPLWDFDNVDDHAACRGGLRPEGARAARSPQQIEAFERGEPLRNRVDRERGY